MVYRLRPHHLICLQFYKGLGYDKDFVRNLDKVVVFWERFPVIVVEGPDDVCYFCPHLENEKCKLGEEKIKTKDCLAKNFLGIKEETLVEKGWVRERIKEFVKDWLEKSCKDCVWNSVCKDVAEKIY